MGAMAEVLKMANNLYINLHGFSVEHRLAPKYAILAHFCNRLTFSHLPFEGPILPSSFPIQPCG